MWDLCRLIFRLIIDLFRLRVALEAEVLVLRQQIIVLRRGKPSRALFRTVDRIILGWPVGLSRAPMSHSPSLNRTPLFAGTVRASDCFGAGSPDTVWVVPRCQLRSGS